MKTFATLDLLDKVEKNNNISVSRLLGLLLQMKKKPDTGWGETKIIWECGQIKYINVLSTQVYGLNEVSNQNKGLVVKLDQDAHQN